MLAPPGSVLSAIGLFVTNASAFRQRHSKSLVT